MSTGDRGDDDAGAGAPGTRALEDVLARAAQLQALDLRAKLQWLEDAAAAAEQAELGDEEGQSGALHLRAALGAVIQWSRGPDTTSAESIAQLDAVVRTLLARGLVGLYRGLAAAYDELVKARAPHRAACVELRDAFREAARAVERGQPVDDGTRARLERARASLG